MPRHRDFSIERFVAAVPPELVGRLATTLGGAPLPAWPTLNGLALDEWLRAPEQAEVEALVRQQMRRINDLAERNMQLLIRAYTRVGLALVPEATPETLALALFLDCPDGFEYAWSRYLLYVNVTDLGDYYFPAGNISPEPGRVNDFKRAVRDWCDGQSRGKQCRVQIFEDRDELIVLIQRGHWVRTVSYFPEGSDEVAFHRFRPAIDDLIVYEPATGMLRVKSSSSADREAYVWHFGLYMARRED